MPMMSAADLLKFAVMHIDRGRSGAGERILHVGAANAGHESVEHLVHSVIDWFFHGLRPFEDELVVVEAFADEGPTLRRFRPRARGRATRIRKRTCHITLVVGEDEE